MKLIRVKQTAPTSHLLARPDIRELIVREMLMMTALEIKVNELFELSETQEDIPLNFDITTFETKVFVLTGHELMQIKGNAEMLQRAAPPEARKFAQQIISILNT